MPGILREKEQKTIKKHNTSYLLSLLRIAILNDQFHVQGVLDQCNIKELYTGSLAQCQGYLHAVHNDPSYKEVAITTGGLEPLIIVCNFQENVDTRWFYVYTVYCPRCKDHNIRQHVISGKHECTKCNFEW